MAIRTRSRNTTYSGGRVENDTGIADSDWYYSTYQVCDDITGQGDNLPFAVTSIERSGGTIHGGIPGVNKYTWYGYPCGYMGDPWLVSHLDIPGRPSNGVMATSVIARTDPSRPETISLEYADSLAGLGKAAKHEMDSRLNKLFKRIPASRFRLLKRAAKLNLIYQFGILPLISDIELLLTFQQAVDRRVKEIERLRTRGLRRTVDCWGGSDFVIAPGVTLHSNGTFLHANIAKRTTTKIRGHIRWYVYDNFFVSDAQVRDEAKRVLLGYDINLETLYELMPWSWLIDYFTNLGTMVKAGSNSFPMHHDKVSIMEYTRTQTVSSAHDRGGSGYTWCTPINCVLETKTRSPTNPTIGARIEFLTGSQLSILGSLAVLRL